MDREVYQPNKDRMKRKVGFIREPGTPHEPIRYSDLPEHERAALNDHQSLEAVMLRMFYCPPQWLPYGSFPVKIQNLPASYKRVLRDEDYTDDDGDDGDDGEGSMPGSPFAVGSHTQTAVGDLGEHIGGPTGRAGEASIPARKIARQKKSRKHRQVRVFHEKRGEQPDECGSRGTPVRGSPPPIKKQTASPSPSRGRKVSSRTYTQVGSLVTEEVKARAVVRAAAILKPLSPKENSSIDGDRGYNYRGSGPLKLYGQTGKSQFFHRDLLTLSPRVYLNDVTINYYMWLLQSRSDSMYKKDKGHGRCAFFSSYLVMQLLNYGHETLHNVYLFNEEVLKYSKTDTEHGEPCFKWLDYCVLFVRLYYHETHLGLISPAVLSILPQDTISLSLTRYLFPYIWERERDTGFVGQSTLRRDE